MSSRRKLVILAAILAIAAVTGHWVSRRAAIDYGNSVAGAFGTLSPTQFANTEELRKFLSSPELTALEDRTEALAFLGGGYHRRIVDLKTGLIYLSGQLALPEQQRLATPPEFGDFTVDSPDRSNDGIIGISLHTLSTFQLKL